MYSEKKPWDTDTNASKAGLERFIRALLSCGGHFTSSFFIGGSISIPNRATSIFFRIWLPVGMEKKFEELSGLTLKEPPRVGADDGWTKE
jgi:hypothetical protein